MTDDWLRQVRLPEPGKRFIESVPLGRECALWDDRVVRVESMSPSGVTVSEERERTIIDKITKFRARYVISRRTNVIYPLKRGKA